VEYPLETLEILVSELLASTRNDTATFHDGTGEDWLRRLYSEIDSIRQSLIRQVFGILKVKEIERFIQHYQGALTHLLDRIYFEEERLVVASTDIKRCFHGFYQSILGLLSFIEERFSKYFDHREKVPEVYFALTRRELGEKWLDFMIQFDDSNERELMDLLNRLFSRFLQDNIRHTVSYEEVIYRKMVLSELEDLKKVDGEGTFTALEQILIYVNFNDKELVQYIVDRIVVLIDMADDLKDKIDQALKFSKSLYQLPTKPEGALFPKHPTLFAQLSAWLVEELMYLERRMGMFAISGTRTTKSEQKALVECRVPVDQIGLFFRAASDTKLISTPSQKKLFEQIAPFLSTARRGVLSADSMRSKSYRPERKDIEGIKDLLMVMYKQVGRY
jgi:hypothetical protein